MTTQTNTPTRFVHSPASHGSSAKNRWRDYARLAHLEMVGLWLTPVIGGFTVRGAELEVREVVLLYIINILFVSWGFIHNDLMDMRVDRLSSELAARPLASGRIPRRHAWMLFTLCIVFNAVVAGIFFGHPLPIAVLIPSAICALLYNRFGKSFEGGDILFAVSAALLCLFGAVAVIGPARRITEIPSLTWVVLAVVFANHLFFNAIPGGLKDLQNDRKTGVRTLAVHYSYMGQDGLAVTIAFKILAVGMKAATAFAVFIPFLFLGKRFSYWQVGLLALVCIGMLMLTIQIVNTRGMIRETIGKLTKREEVVSSTLLWLLLVNVVGFPGALFLAVAPMLWFITFNYVVYGKIINLPRTY